MPLASARCSALFRKKLQPVPRSVHLFTRVQRAPAPISKGFNVANHRYSLSLWKSFATPRPRDWNFSSARLQFLLKYTRHTYCRVFVRTRVVTPGGLASFKARAYARNGGRESRGKLCGPGQNSTHFAHCSRLGPRLGFN